MYFVTQGLIQNECLHKLITLVTRRDFLSIRRWPPNLVCVSSWGCSGHKYRPYNKVTDMKFKYYPLTKIFPKFKTIFCHSLMDIPHSKLLRSKISFNLKFCQDIVHCGRGVSITIKNFCISEINFTLLVHIVCSDMKYSWCN